MKLAELKKLAQYTIDKYGSVDAALTVKSDYPLAHGVLKLAGLVEKADELFHAFVYPHSLILSKNAHPTIQWEKCLIENGYQTNFQTMRVEENKFGISCPKCGGENLMIERSPRGKRHCMNCRHSWENWENEISNLRKR